MCTCTLALGIFQFVHLFVHASVRPSALPACLLARLSVCLSVYLQFCISAFVVLFTTDEHANHGIQMNACMHEDVSMLFDTSTSFTSIHGNMRVWVCDYVKVVHVLHILLVYVYIYLYIYLHIHIQRAANTCRTMFLVVFPVRMRNHETSAKKVTSVSRRSRRMHHPTKI